MAANMLSYQSDFGGWPKNLDLTAKPFTGRRDELVGELKPIFDNSATTDEIRYLARMHKATGDNRYLRAVQDGLDYILIAQYPTGGWPQFYPLDAEYHRHITFNDNSMVRILLLLQEMGMPGVFDSLDADRRAAAQIAFHRGIECILKCQIKVDGRLTAWCAQHDELDYSPRPARKFELVSLSGAESVALVKLLMSHPRPAPEIVDSIESAVAWLQTSRIDGWRIQELTTDDTQGHNFSATPDPSAEPFGPGSMTSLPTNPSGPTGWGAEAGHGGDRLGPSRLRLDRRLGPITLEQGLPRLEKASGQRRPRTCLRALATSRAHRPGRRFHRDRHSRLGLWV